MGWNEAGSDGGESLQQSLRMKTKPCEWPLGEGQELSHSELAFIQALNDAFRGPLLIQHAQSPKNHPTRAICS